MKIGSFMPPKPPIDEPKMNVAERVLALVASLLWRVGDLADVLGAWADVAGHAVRDRAVARTNRVCAERIAAWYAEHPQPPTVVHTSPGVRLKRAAVVEADAPSVQGDAQ